MIKQRLAKLETRVKAAGIGECPACHDGRVFIPKIITLHGDETEPPDAWRCPECGRDVPENMRLVIRLCND